MKPWMTGLVAAALIAAPALAQDAEDLRATEALNARVTAQARAVDARNDARRTQHAARDAAYAEKLAAYKKKLAAYLRQRAAWRAAWRSSMAPR
jgi:hypothetical protein